MSCFQANLRRPCFYTNPARKSESGSILSRSCVSSIRPYDPLKCSVKFASTTHRQMPVVKCRQAAIVCVSGSRDKAESGSEGFKWNPLEKAIGGFKGQSIEEILRQQIEKQECAGGGSGKIPPRGNGGGGGRGNGSDGAGDEGLSDAIDETIQVTLATLGFIFLYVYIITGEELILLLKDYMKYFSGGGKSNRLQTAMSTWSRFWAGIFREEQKPEKHWLEKEILRTTTWYDSPEKTARYIEESYARRNSDDDDEY